MKSRLSIIAAGASLERYIAQGVVVKHISSDLMALEKVFLGLWICDLFDEGRKLYSFVRCC